MEGSVCKKTGVFGRIEEGGVLSVDDRNDNISLITI
jgi:hypothetical protein